MTKVEYRGVDPYPMGEEGSGWRMIHVPTEVAALLTPNDDHDHVRARGLELIKFVDGCKGVYLPGIRRPKDRRYFRKGGFHLEPTAASTIATDDFADLATDQSPPTFTFVELFAGIGGFRLGLEAIGGSCVLASERNANACTIYRRHFHQNNYTTATQTNIFPPDVLIECDILDLHSTDFPANFHILTAGFPCQPFTVRGPQSGLSDTDRNSHPRGQMYQELVRVLNATQPPFFLFENVVGLVTMEGGYARHRKGVHEFKAGSVMEEVLSAFRKCGYRVDWNVINSGGVVPQYRERVYFVGSRSDLLCPTFDWTSIERRDSCPALRNVLESSYGAPDSPIQTEGCELTQRQYDKLQSIHSGRALNIARLDLDSYAPTLTSCYRQPASSYTRYVMEERDGTVRHGEPLRPRFLTPRECARVMGFPDEFDISAPVGGKVGHVYKGLGNAVVPGVVEGIGREILRLMREVRDRKVHNTQ
jgi:DNA (cytosine-5)-methyltransferase 1